MSEEMLSDMEIAINIIYHMDNPCVCPVTGENIRYAYKKMAWTFIGRTGNGFARELLRRKLNQYSND